MTGWRLGYAVAPKHVSQCMEKLLNNMTSCPVSFVQRAAVAALKGLQKPVEQMVDTFAERRKVICQLTRNIDDVSIVEPEGAFYLFVNVKKILRRMGINSETLVQRLPERHGVAVLHGSAMGRHGEGYVRFSFANSIGNIREGIRRFKMACETPA